MPTFSVKISDTVTYLRELVVTIDAPDADTALTEALDGADDYMSQATGDELSETQIDNTPYNAVLAAPEA